MKRFIYFAHCAETGLVKIGIAADPKQRMRHVRKECGYDVRLMACAPGTSQDELELKKQFAACHAGHEWFRIEGAFADYVRAEMWGKRLPEHDKGRNKLIAKQNRRYTTAIKKSRKTTDATLQRRFAQPSL